MKDEDLRRLEDGSVSLIIVNFLSNCFSFANYFNKEELKEKPSYFDYLDSLTKTGQECERVLKPNGKLCIITPSLFVMKGENEEDKIVLNLQSDIDTSLVIKTNFYLGDLYIWKGFEDETNISTDKKFCNFITVYTKDSEKINEEERTENVQQIGNVSSLELTVNHLVFERLIELFTCDGDIVVSLFDSGSDDFIRVVKKRK